PWGFGYLPGLSSASCSSMPRIYWAPPAWCLALTPSLPPWCRYWCALSLGLCCYAGRVDPVSGCPGNLTGLSRIPSGEAVLHVDDSLLRPSRAFHCSEITDYLSSM